MNLQDAFKDVTEFEKKDPEWVIKDFIPVGLTFMAGPPKKSYKSTLTIIEACLAARWATKALPPWMSCDLGGPTMMFSYEATGGEVLWVIEDGLLLDPKKGYISIAEDPWQFQLDKPQTVQEMVDYIDERDPRVVIMDPFRNMWSGDENDSGEVIKVLGPIQKLLKAKQAAGIVVHHINKPPTDKDKANNAGGMYSMRGSSAIPGLSDAIVVIEPTSTEGVIRINSTFKRGLSWTRTIQLGVPGYGWPAEGQEILPEHTLAVEDAWTSMKTGGHDMDWMAELGALTKTNVATVRDAIRALDRNLRLNITHTERTILGVPQ